VDCSRRLWVLSFAVIAACLAPAAPARADIGGIRQNDAVLDAMLARGRERSPTFRRLLARLGDSNLIVHVWRSQRPNPGAGFTQFIVESGGYRFVRITINVAGVSDGAVALLGHELQHAVEIADDPAVRDEASYTGLYRAIGYPSCLRRRCYDTEDAVNAGRRVLREMLNPFVFPVSFREKPAAQQGKR
jgi:hypothetical protein